jgi:hypothetical protein
LSRCPIPAHGGSRCSLYTNNFYVDRAPLALGARPYLEAHALIHLRAPSKCIERLDVHEDVRPALSRLDEAESAFIVPGFDGSVEAHRLGFLTD